MSSAFQSIRAFDLIGGTPVAFPTALCTPLTQQPSNIPFKVDWTIYFTAAGNAPSSLGVNINLKGTTPNAAKLDAIRSVKIDNTNSYCTIYVWFPDTSDVVTCPPQTVVTMPVNTNDQKCVVIASGLVTGFLPVTMVYFYNVQLPPSVDAAIQLTFPQWKGSPAVQVGNSPNPILTPGYAPPALMDQLDRAALVMVSNTTVNATMFSSPIASGFFYLGSFTITMFAYNQSGTTSNTVNIKSLGASGTIFTTGLVLTSADINITRTIFTINGMNLRISATEQWVFQVVCGNGVLGGTMQCYTPFTYNTQ